MYRCASVSRRPFKAAPSSQPVAYPPQRISLSDQRQQPRFEQTFEVRIRDLSSDKEEVIGRATNLSRGGMCVELQQPLERASCVHCDIALQQIPVHLPMLTQVRWVKRVNSSSYRCGLFFVAG